MKKENNEINSLSEIIGGKVILSEPIFVKYINNLNILDLSELSVIERRIFFFLLGYMHKNQDTHMIIEETSLKKDIHLRCMNKEDMNELMDSLTKTFFNLGFKFETSDKSIIDLVHFADRCSFDKEKRTLEVELSRNAIKLVCNLGSEFTTFEISEYSQLRKRLSQVIYQIMKQWKTIGKTSVLSLTELKKYTGYENLETKKFMQKIKDSLEEIENKTNFKNISIEKINDNNHAITGIKILFSRQNNYIETSSNKIIEEGKYIHDIFGLTEEKEKELTKRYSKKTYENTINRYLKYNFKEKNVETVVEWLNEQKAREKFLEEERKTGQFSLFNNIEETEYDFDELENLGKRRTEKK